MGTERVTDDTTLAIKDLSVDYDGKRVVDGVSLAVRSGQIVGLVGESGAGKSTVLRSVVGLMPSTAEVRAGRILFTGRDLLTLSDKDLSDIRGSRIATIFQNPGSSLDPSMRIGRQIVEVLRRHSDISKQAARMESHDLLRRMGLSDVQTLAKAYPFELSGGMQQRVAIALAMAFKPDILLADEPTSALDSTTQLSIVKELLELNATFGMAILLVTHNIGLAYHVCDDIHVMSDGKIVESGSSESIVKDPRAELTQKLIKAVPEVV